MIDPNYIYENEELIKQKYSEKGYDFDYKYFSRVFKGRKKVIQDLENLRKKQNDFNKSWNQGSKLETCIGAFSRIPNKPNKYFCLLS